MIMISILAVALLGASTKPARACEPKVKAKATKTFTSRWSVSANTGYTSSMTYYGVPATGYVPFGVDFNYRFHRKISLVMGTGLGAAYAGSQPAFAFDLRVGPKFDFIDGRVRFGAKVLLTYNLFAVNDPGHMTALHLVGLEPRLYVGHYLTKDRRWSVDYSIGPRVSLMVGKTRPNGDIEGLDSDSPYFSFGYLASVSFTYRF
jgi:hypothetical protein